MNAKKATPAKYNPGSMGVGSMSLNKPQTNTAFSDPFSTSGGMKPISKPMSNNSSIKNDNIFGDLDPFSTNKPPVSDPFGTNKPPASDPFGMSKPAGDPFSAFSSTPKPPAGVSSSINTGLNAPTINMSSGFGSLSANSDPFAELITEEKKEVPKPNMSSGFGYGNNQPQAQRQASTSSSNSFSSGKATYGSNTDPFSSFNASSIDLGSSFGSNRGSASTKPATSQPASMGYNTNTSVPGFSNMPSTTNYGTNPSNNSGFGGPGFNTGGKLYAD